MVHFLCIRLRKKVYAMTTDVKVSLLIALCERSQDKVLKQKKKLIESHVLHNVFTMLQKLSLQITELYMFINT